jgi:hypothetical protein
MDLSEVPTEELYAELGRRRAEARDYQLSCECGKCKKCRAREYKREQRKRVGKA